MGEADKEREEVRSKLYVISTVLSVLFIAAGALFWARSVMAALETLDPDVIWDEAERALAASILGGGFYILGTLEKSRKARGGSGYFVIAISYEALLILAALFFYYFVFFVLDAI